MSVPVGHLFALSAALFTVGVAGVLLRRNAMIVLMSVELMLNAVNLTLVAASRLHLTHDGQLFVFFALTVAAAEVAVGLALVVAIHRALGRVDVDDVGALHG